MLILILRNGGVSMALILLCALLLRRKRRVRILHIVGLCLFALAMSAVFAVTGVTPMSGGFSVNIKAEQLSLTPFAGIAEIVRTGVKNRDPQYAILNLLGNVVLFLPVGFFVPLLWRRYRKLWKTALFGLAVSLLVEVTQLFLSRGSDVDDLILNVVGTLAGYGLFRLFRRLAKPIAKRCMLGKSQRKSVWRFFPYACVLVPLIVALVLGTVDRGRFLAPAAEPANAVSAQEEAPPEDAMDADGNGEAPRPAANAITGEEIGTLTLSDTEPMNIMSQLTIPPVIAEVSDADRSALAKLFSGHTLLDAQPACDSDLVVQSGQATLIVHTECGALSASLPELSGATTLTPEELAALGEILVNYGIAMAGTEAPDEADTPGGADGGADGAPQ